jgi:hypothetical protein
MFYVIALFAYSALQFYVAETGSMKYPDMWLWMSGFTAALGGILAVKIIREKVQTINGYKNRR